MTLSEELTWRGLISQTTYANLTQLDDKPIAFYWGVDPSADSMTVGNLAAAMLVKCFARYGHKPVLLVGGATGSVGDPDGKNQERQLITMAKLASNKAAIVKQYKQLFGDTQFEVVDNYDWFKDMNYLTFLRDIGKHVPTRQMLSREFVQSRLSEDGNGISYAEFSYVLIQAYDYLYLYNNHGVTLQVCGADQWGNCIAGVDLIRRKEGGEAHVFSTPLVVDPATGVKFGKSESGAVWLDPSKTSPTQFYQFWINTSDQAVESLLKVYTEFEQPEIVDIVKRGRDDPSARYAQTKLAEAVTKQVHGDEATKVAQTVTDTLIGKINLSGLDDRLLGELRHEIKSIKADVGADLAQVLVDSELASSKTEARTLIASNAISINGQKANGPTLSEDNFVSGRLLLRRGKAYKDSALVEQG